MFPDATRYTAFLNRLNRIHGQLGALLSFTGTASSIRDQTISLSSDVVVITRRVPDVVITSISNLASNAINFIYCSNNTKLENHT